MTYLEFIISPRWGGVNLSNRRFDKRPERALSDYLLHKYLLEKEPNKYTFLSKGYIRSIVYIQQNAKIADVSVADMVKGLKMREKIMILLTRLMLRVINKL